MATRDFKFGEIQHHPQPIGSLLTYQAERAPDAPALTFEGQTWTRQMLEASANRTARRLSALGVGKDDVVSIMLPNGPELHIFTFAIWKLGATPAPLSPRLPEHELRAILELTQPKLIVGPPPDRASGFPTVPADLEPSSPFSAAALAPQTPRFTKAITSGGSTGRPKVIFDHAPGALDPDVIGLGMKLDDVILMSGPLYHNAPFGITHRAMCRGGHVVETLKFDPLETLALIERHRVQWLYMVPTMMRRIWALPAKDREQFDLSSLEMVVHMAAPCPPWLKRAWIDWLGPDRIWEVYAGTERMGAVCIGGRDWLDHPGSVGRPADGKVRIIDEAGADCPPDVSGEIMFSFPEAASASFHYVGADMRRLGDWAGYGDIGHFDAGGFLYIDDRRTDMIVSGGSNVFPAEVEGALDAHADIIASVVVGLPDDDLGQRVHAIVEPRALDAMPDRIALARHLSRFLVRYKLPATFEVSTHPLRDEAGKVRRAAVREASIQARASGRVFDVLDYSTLEGGG